MHSHRRTDAARIAATATQATDAAGRLAPPARAARRPAGGVLAARLAAPGLAALALLAAGCGGSHHPAPARAATAHAVGYLAASELQRDLGNGFRAGLGRLAVMDQPVDDASDLGQELPTGLLDRVECSEAAPKPATAAPWAWRCTVRWQTAGGRAKTTKYAVRLFPTRCFAAGADPALPTHRDPTIGSFAEHPLNTVVSVKRGC